MGKAGYIQQVNDNLHESFSHGSTSIRGWLGGLAMMLPSKATIGFVVICLWLMDLYTGTTLALRIGNWNEAVHGPMSPELVQAIKDKKKGPFSWERLGWSIDKLIKYLGLAVLCGILKDWVRTENPMYYGVTSFACGLICFVLVWTDFRSIVNNVALSTSNSMLLWANGKISRAGQKAINSMPGFAEDEEEKKDVPARISE